MKKFSNGIKLSKLQKILFFKNFMIPYTKFKIIYFFNAYSASAYP